LEFIFAEESPFEIPENKNLSKISSYTVHILLNNYEVYFTDNTWLSQILSWSFSTVNFKKIATCRSKLYGSYTICHASYLIHALQHTKHTTILNSKLILNSPQFGMIDMLVAFLLRFSLLYRSNCGNYLIHSHN